MWLVIKYKKNNLGLLQDEVKKIMGKKIEFYLPKMQFEKKINRKIKKVVKILTKDYLFCKIENFNKTDILQKLKFCKGVKYILESFNFSQKEIETFIFRCKKHEDKYGNIQSSFFSVFENTKIKFLNGPFSNQIFNIEKNFDSFIKTSLNNIKITINKKDNLYQTVY